MISTWSSVELYQINLAIYYFNFGVAWSIFKTNSC